MAYLAGLDLGTSSIKAVIYDSDQGKVVAAASRPTPVNHPREGWSEHDPEQLWQVVCACIREVTNGRAVQAIAISSMAEAGLPVDRQGKPLYPILAWYDRRSTSQAEWIEARLGRELIYRISGQRVTASFGLTKWLWILQQDDSIVKKTAAWLPLPTYILERLCGERVVDFSIASRALLLDQATRDWSPDLMDVGGFHRENLPRLLPGGSAVGRLSRKAAEETGLPAGALCVLGGHDHLCASFAAGGQVAGAVVDSTGTAEAVVMLLLAFRSDSSIGERGFACYAHVLPDLYVLKGGLKAAGSSIAWLVRLLSPDPLAPDYAGLEAQAATTCAKKSGPLWLPHFLESGSPEADPFSRAALVGAQLEHTRGDLFRGLLESLACWLRANLEEMQLLSGTPVNTVALIGGATRITLLNQLKADLLNRPVAIPELPEAAAIGAALLAGVGCGLFNSPQEATRSLRYGQTWIHPHADHVQWYDRLYHRSYRPLYRSLREINRSF